MWGPLHVGCPYRLGGRLFSTQKVNLRFQALSMARLLVCQLISVAGSSVHENDSTAGCKIVYY